MNPRETHRRHRVIAQQAVPRGTPVSCSVHVSDVFGVLCCTGAPDLSTVGFARSAHPVYQYGDGCQISILLVSVRRIFFLRNRYTGVFGVLNLLQHVRAYVDSEREPPRSNNSNRGSECVEGT